MIETVDLSGTRLVVESSGEGPPLLFVHGWPFHRKTWRRVIARLEKSFTCIRFDLPGLGESPWSEDDVFGFRRLADLTRSLAERLRLERYTLVAQDAGGTVARLVAAAEPERVSSLILMNTEIPGHRPPFIEFYQKLLRLPGTIDVMRVLLLTDRFRRSPMGFGGCFTDLDLLDREFEALFIAPILRDRRRARGAAHFLTSLEIPVIDELERVHKEIGSSVYLIWGRDDPTFPIERARTMAKQFARCELIEISQASLLVHEEQPEEVARAIERSVGAREPSQTRALVL